MTSSPATSSPTTSSLATQPHSRLPGWTQDRWVQGITAGVMTLVPVRRYPEWLRQAAMWVPAAGVTTVLITPGVWKAMAKAAQTSGEAQAPGPDDLIQQEPEPEELKPHPTVPRRIARWGIGLAAGASIYGYMRVALWADGAMEDGLREMGVRRPRLVLAGLGGLAAGVTARGRTR